MSRSALAAGIRHLRGKLASQQLNEESDEQLLHAFTDRREENAFAVLLRRHGPMVLHVCRRVLGHEQDAEDAFQAAFLVLARKHATLRNKAALASFLHGIAYRTALKAKQSAARRHKYESQTPPRTPADPADELSWREVRTLLDEEIARLPEKYRIVFILSCLENLSREETARRLGLKEGTVASRLAEARKRLQQRLTRRGVELTAVLGALSLPAPTVSALPVVLRAVTIKAAVGEGIAGVVSASVAELVESATTAMLLSKVKIAVVVLLAVSLVSGASLWLCHGRVVPTAALPLSAAPETADQPKPRVPRQEKRPTVEIGGRVVDPEGKPVRGAKLLFLWWGERLPSKVWAVSGADGRFSFTVARSPVANSGWEIPAGEHPYILAVAEGYGLAVAQLDKAETTANLTLRLIKDDVPIRGRVLDLEGRPVAGVRVRISDCQPLNMPPLYIPKKGDLTAWLAALKINKMAPWDVKRAHLTGLYSFDFHLLIPPVTTGMDGRFQLRGIGRERMVHLRLEGPTIATQIVNVMTRPSETIRLPLSRRHPKGESITYHGAALEVLAAPTKPVVGVVRDRDTGKPLAGVTIEPKKITNPFNISNQDAGLIRTTTDKEGRYRLIGLPKGEDNQLLATTDDLPYLPVSKKVENTPGLSPATVDFALKRGIWVKGRVTEKTTGKPLKGSVGYYCFLDNPHKKEIPPISGVTGRATREDGSFQLVAAPGHGVIAVQVSHNNRYLGGVGAKKIKGPRRKMGSVEVFDTLPYWCPITSLSTLVEIDPKPGDESLTCDLIVVPARALKGTVLGPDGKPLSGARQYRWDTLSSSEFTVWGLPANKLHEPWKIEFVHEGKKLAGFVTVHGDEKEPLQVHLQPWGALTGRLVTPQGEPLTGVEVSCSQVGDDYPDKKGWFRIEGLTPGLEYKVSVSKEGRVLPIISGEPKNLIAKPGEIKDLGVLKVKQME